MLYRRDFRHELHLTAGSYVETAIFITPSVEALPFLTCKNVQPFARKVLGNTLIERVWLGAMDSRCFSAGLQFPERISGKFSLAAIPEQNMLGHNLVWPERARPCTLIPCDHGVKGVAPMLKQVESCSQYRLSVSLSLLLVAHSQRNDCFCSPLRNRLQQLVFGHCRIIQLRTLVLTNTAFTCFALVPRRIDNNDSVITDIVRIGQ